MNKKYLLSLFIAFGISVSFTVSAENSKFVLEVKGTSTVPIWNDKGSGSDHDVSFWRPVTSEEYFSLGDIALPEYNPPYAAVIVRDKGHGNLAPPIDYSLIWTDKDSGSDQDGALWRPVPPENFVCLGDVATNNYQKPDNNLIRCVKSSLLDHTSANWVWDDKDSGSEHDVSVFNVELGYGQTFKAAPGYQNKISTTTIPVMKVKSEVIFDKERPLAGAALSNTCRFGTTPKKQIRLLEGKYTLSDLEQLGLGNDEISTIAPALGYTVTVFEDDNFLGSSKSFSNTDICLLYLPLGSGNWDNRISSLIIKAVDIPNSDITEIKHTSGSFVRKEYGWTELQQDDLNFANFKEYKRDQATITVYDDSRDLYLEFDLKSKWINFSIGTAPSEGSSQLYRITETIRNSHLDEKNLQDIQHAIAKHAPTIVLHPNEQFKLTSVEAFLANSELTNSKGIKKSVTRETLKTEAEKLLQEHNHDRVWLELNNDQAKLGDMNSAKAYVHAILNQDKIELQFWLLYAYNGNGTMRARFGELHTAEFGLEPLGEHQGDWESVFIHVDRHSDTVNKVSFFQHGERVDVLPDALEYEDGRVKVYASLNGHASYPYAGDNANRVAHKSFGLGHLDVDLLNFTENSNTLLDTSLHHELVYVDNKPVNNGTFMSFPGRWGNSRDNFFSTGKMSEILWKHLYPQLLLLEGACLALPLCQISGGPIWLLPTATVAAEAAKDDIVKALAKKETQGDGPTSPLNK